MIARIAALTALAALVLTLPACAGAGPDPGPVSESGLEPGGEPARVLLVGDSVTQGSAGDWTWRYRLWQHLEASGAEVDLVGPADQVAGATAGDPDLGYADPDFDRDHASRWGRSFAGTDWSIGELVEAHDPDVVVELLGINDVLGLRATAQELVERARTFVADARAADPQLDIVLAELPQTWFDEVSAYDQALGDLAEELATDGSDVVVARPAEAFVRDVDTYDPVHPSPSGEVKIAAGVADALARLDIGEAYPRPLPDAEPVPTRPAELTAVTAPGAARLSWRPPPGGWTAYVWRRNATQDEDWLRLPVGITDTEWTSAGLIGGDTYEFRLQMAKGTSESEIFSNVVSVVPGAPEPAGAP
ncbi:MAG: GDSL-type esterase/lipase family protein [Nocardioides sp.]